ncbi:hypothetical protein [Nocardia rhizosphaerae]|uniref:Uncharacterized protein n=1 Tax=Nocardia rhizosphaerae TaxID=1691571 RepID=A0ABV8L2K3_9NOCA
MTDTCSCPPDDCHGGHTINVGPVTVDAPKHLALDDLRTLRDATAYSYEAGDYPPNMPAHLLEYTAGDGGLLSLLNQAIKQAELLDAATPENLASTERPSDARLQEVLDGRAASWRMTQSMAAELLALRAALADRDDLYKRVEELEAAQREPIGYAVITDHLGARWVQTGPVASLDHARARARVYVEQAARVVELREVAAE